LAIVGEIHVIRGKNNASKLSAVRVEHLNKQLVKFRMLLSKARSSNVSPNAVDALNIFHRASEFSATRRKNWGSGWTLTSRKIMWTRNGIPGTRAPLSKKIESLWTDAWTLEEKGDVVVILFALGRRC
jgi:hypothetical protein